MPISQRLFLRNINSSSSTYSTYNVKYEVLRAKTIRMLSSGIVVGGRKYYISDEVVTL